ncbi:MAG: hypothetical protein E7441_04480, partial [Ruminococcaceae bacterium]|nr:hypothetical protein [Oscillospiraceae bacterium]
ILAANSPNAYSIALNVTRGGTFEANVSFKRKANGYTADVWLVRKADNAGLTDKTLISTTDLTTLVNGIDTNKDAQKLGTINMDAEVNEQTITTWALGNATVTPGEYRLIFIVTEKNTSANSNGEIISFSLSPKQEKKLTSIILSADKTEIELTEKAKLTATAVYSVGGNALLEPENITYKSSDESIATVDENGVVVPKKPGEVTITATAKGTEISAQTKISIIGKRLVNAELVSSAKKLLIGESAVLMAKGYLSDGSEISANGSVVSAPDAKVTYTSLTPEILSVDDSGTVTALCAGTGRVRATLSFEGSEMSREMNITAIADTDSLEYNFKWEAYTAATGSFGPRETIESVHYAKYSFADIDPKVSAQWRIDGIYQIANAGGTIAADGIVHNALGDSYAGIYSLALNVTIDGTFATNVSVKRKEKGYAADVWLVRKADNDGFLMDKSTITVTELEKFVAGIEQNPDARKLGSINMDAEENEEAITTWVLDDVTVTPGEYRLIFDVTGGETYPQGGYTYSGGELVSFSFGPVQEKKITSVILSADKSEIELAERAKLTATAAYSTGTIGLLEQESVAYVCSDESIATVDENGVVAPKKPGEVTITATVKGTEISTQKKIRIVDKKFINAHLMSSKKTLLIGESALLTAKGYLSDGREVSAPEAEVTYTSLTPGILSVDENGTVKALRAGNGRVRAALSLGGSVISCEVTINTSKESKPEVLTYEFSSLAHADSSTTDGVMSPQTMINIKNLKLFDIENTMLGKAQWGFVNIKKEGRGENKHQYNKDTEWFYVYFGDSTEPPRFDGKTKPKNAAILGYEIYVPHNGEYNMSTKHYTGDEKYLDATYLLVEKPEDAEKYYAINPDGTAKTGENALWSAEGLYQLALDNSEDCVIGHFEGYPRNTDSQYKTSFLGTREIKAGSYFLLIIPDGRNEKAAFSTVSNNNLMLCNVCNFKLTPASYDTFSVFRLQAEKTALEIGEKTALTISAEYTESGKIANLSGVTYKSSDDSIATVSEDGIVTAKRAGKVTVTAEHAEKNGTSKIEIEVLPTRIITAQAEISPKTVEVGSGAAVTAKGYLTTGEIADMTDGEFSYEVLTQEILSVDENGNISTHRAGTGKVGVTLMLDGYRAYSEAEITVTDKSAIKSALLSAPETVGYLREADLTLTGEMESGYGVDFSQAEIRWFVNSTPAGGVSVTPQNRLYGDIFKAAAEIYAEITLNGGKVTTNKVNVSVVESSLHDVVLKFTSLRINKISEVTLGEYGWALNTELSHSSAANITPERFHTYFNTNAADADLVFDIDIPNAGVYTPIISCTRQAHAPKLAYVYVDGIFAGEYEAYNRSLSENFRSFFLTKGVHTLTLRPVEKGKGFKFPLQLIRFAAREALPTVDKILTGKDAYTISIGESVNLGAYISMTDGFEYAWQTERDGDADPYASVAYEIDGDGSAEVSADGTITAKKEGSATVTVTVSLNDEKTTKEIPVTVVPKGAETADNILTSVEIEAPFYAMNPETEGVQLTAIGKNADGEKLDLTHAEITWSIEENDAMTVSESGYITPLGLGDATVTVTVTLGSVTLSGQHFFSVREGKVGRTYYPDDAAEIAAENVSKYDWAKSTVKSAIAAADKYVGMEDFLWELVPAEGIPRSCNVGYRSDPDSYNCRYCGVDLRKEYTNFPWIVNPFTRKWKIQCPDCKRLFPSNDFESFYELGRDEHGVFDVTRARKKHHNMLTHGDENAVCDCPYIPPTEKSDEWYEFYGYGNPEGYLYNELYSELRDPSKAETYNIDPWKKVEVNGTRWGVDDGFGYDTGRKYPAGTPEIHTYLSYYMHYGVWMAQNQYNEGVVQKALEKLRDAYLYTGDEKYGRVGAILLDRVADVYPGYDLRPYLSRFSNSDGGSKAGKIVGRIWEANVFSRVLPMAYDAFWPMYDDPYVVSFLDEKAKKYKLEHKFDENGNVTPETIRRNCEDGICREGYKAALDASSYGNFGMHQAGVALAAVVLDSHPETDEMFEWIFKYEETDMANYNTGGDVGKTLMAKVSRDGVGDEGAAGYNRGWVTRLVYVADAASSYDEVAMGKLYEHPKYVSMITAWLPYTLVRRGVPSVGDSGALAGYAKMPDNDQVLMNGFKNVKEVNEEQAIKIAQLMWFLRDGDMNNIHYDILTRDPESIQTEIKEIIDTYGEYDFDKSSMLTGHGFGVLRAGTLHGSDVKNGLVDTQRDFWMYFGGALSHKHSDGLNLGIEAYGIDLSGDIGYPEATGQDANRSQWVNKTISHNCVVVNESSIRSGNAALKPLHFDAKDTRVKVMDVDGGNSAYADTDEYRRTVVMVDYDSEISYGIDFFKVLGGNDHLYSFHANSIEDPEFSDNLKFIAQNGGTYAGADIPFGNDPWTNTANAHSTLKFPDGYTWLDDIKRADNPGVNEFWLDYKIKDYRKLSRNSNMDIHMRLTAVNDWAPEEVTLANGLSTRSGGELKIINHMEYLLIRRKGETLNTLFTTVIEPYNKNRYIKSIKRVDIEPTGDIKPGKTDAANAVRVELVDGRVDYVVYAQNNDVTYRITDSENDYSFEFKGFVGVWTVAGENVNIYSYIHDGEMMGTETEKLESLDAAIKGEIRDFERELSFENWIDVEFDREITQAEADTLSDRLLNVEFKGHGNAAYIIESVDMSDATHGRINFGNVSLINGFVDDKDESKGYTYDVAVGKSFEIPMSYEEDNAPVFDEISDNYTTSAGSTITVKLNATADDNGPLTYSARTLPRGASFNAETATFSWKPTGSQVGDSLVAIDAVDEYGRIATQYFTVTVYGSTTAKPSEKTEENTGTSTEGTAGGGGGGGGGAAPETSDKTNTDETDKNEESENTAPDTSGETDNIRFTDLGNHEWAEDAINELADDGIIKGTTARTYSPQNNITRADFALLLVRAFKLESDNTENFDDVSVNDYYASELAIARNTGIVNGIGDNKYAPRNTITRQDMMVIVYRALQASLALKGGGPSNDGGGISPSQSLAATALPKGEPSKAEQYPDFTSVAPYAQDAVSALISAGVVNGKSGSIAPTDYTTRAEVAVLIKRILDFVG